MTQTHAMFPNGVFNVVRATLAIVIAIGVVGLMFMLAAFLTMAALIAAGVAVIGMAGYWLYQKVRGKTRRKQSSGPTILEAKHGPEGWTVDGQE